MILCSESFIQITVTGVGHSGSEARPETSIVLDNMRKPPNILPSAILHTVYILIHNVKCSMLVDMIGYLIVVCI